MSYAQDDTIRSPTESRNQVLAFLDPYVENFGPTYAGQERDVSVLPQQEGVVLSIESRIY